MVWCRVSVPRRRIVIAYCVHFPVVLYEASWKREKLRSAWSIVMSVVMTVITVVDESSPPFSIFIDLPGSLCFSISVCKLTLSTFHVTHVIEAAAALQPSQRIAAPSVPRGLAIRNTCIFRIRTRQPATHHASSRTTWTTSCQIVNWTSGGGCLN